MSDTTTTDDPILPDDGGQEPVPSTDSEATAAPATDDQPTTPDEGDKKPDKPDESVPEPPDDKLASFAKGLGIEDVSDLSERELKLLKVAKDNQAEFQRNRQKASELEKTLTNGLQADIAAADPDAVERLAAEVQGLKLAQSVNGFFVDNPDAKAFEPTMTEIVVQRPEIGQMVKQGYLSVNDLYNLARGSDPNIVAEARKQGGKEALQAVADKQQAKAIPGRATDSSFDTKKPDPFLEAFDSV